MNQSVVEKDVPPTDGYADPSAYLALNASRNDRDPERKFSLHYGLQHWSERLPSGLLRERLGASPRCLIQGSASSENADLLLAFLRRHGVPTPDIHLIDLIDLRVCGHVHPATTFHRADAGDLSQVFADATFDLIVQDHLLNCAPFASYEKVLAEMRRILRPDGLALLHYSDPADFPSARGDAFRERISTPPGAAHLSLKPDERESLSSLGAEHRLVSLGSRAVMITLPLGNLEFFMPFEEFRSLVERSALDLLQTHVLRITDSEGLPCRRHHCLIARRAP